MNESKSVSKDPVCGMTVDEATALHAERDGKTFYFCSDHCRNKFLSTPAGAKPEARSGCCCHNERTTTMNESKSVTKDPICGMTVDKATALQAERDGKMFYFCSDHCRQTFLSTPASAKPEEKTGGCCG